MEVSLEKMARDLEKRGRNGRPGETGDKIKSKRALLRLMIIILIN